MSSTRESMIDDRHLARVQAIVMRIAGPGRTPVDIGPDTSLAEGGFWLDSVATLEVIVACEEEFGVTFDWQVDLDGESLGTIRSLAELIGTKLPGPCAGPRRPIAP